MERDSALKLWRNDADEAHDVCERQVSPIALDSPQHVAEAVVVDAQ